jgi:hypothetical protein
LWNVTANARGHQTRNQLKRDGIWMQQREPTSFAHIEPVQDGRIYIERINAPFMFQLGGKAASLERA